jgi:Ca2+-binding RTX toxin-like protein
VLSTDSIVGTNAINLTGNELNNEIYGNNGANMLNGGGGAGDYLVGWGGDDTYLIFTGGEIVVENVNGGRDVVYSTVSYALAAGTSVEVLSTNSIAGTNAIDLTGNELGQEVYGNNGANTLNGGGGGDYLAGFGGADSFAFTTALGSGNVDHLADFSAVDDTILLENAVFTGLANGALAAGAFVAGAAAADADDRIVYNSATGQVFFDADGNGAGAQILFATVNAGTVLTASDFMVI